jgi:Tfp pilus assembly ATPase PilU
MLQSVDPASGMQSLDTHLLKLVRDGQIHAGEALQFAMYPERFHALLDDAELLQDTADL